MRLYNYPIYLLGKHFRWVRRVYYKLFKPNYLWGIMDFLRDEQKGRVFNVNYDATKFNKMIEDLFNKLK